jgi:hypothetical protein
LIGYAVAPITLTNEQLVQVANERAAQVERARDGAVLPTLESVANKFMEREEAKRLKLLAAHVHKYKKPKTTTTTTTTVTTNTAAGGQSLSNSSSSSSSGSSSDGGGSGGGIGGGGGGIGGGGGGGLCGALEDEDALSMGLPVAAILETRPTADVKIAKKKGFEEEVLVRWADPKEKDTWEYKQYIVLFPPPAEHPDDNAATTSSSASALQLSSSSSSSSSSIARRPGIVSEVFTVVVSRAARPAGSSEVRCYNKGGLGAQLSLQHSLKCGGSRTKVERVKVGSPFHLAGVRAGDRLITLAGNPLQAIQVLVLPLQS